MKNERKILVVGAGQIGSCHLQALKNVSFPLDINVVDLSQASLATAKQRYDEIPKKKYQHKINYSQKINSGQNIDLAIIATTSDVRAKTIKDILKNNKVRYFLLEKILFDKNEYYYEIENIFSKLKTKAWVNCARRIWPIYSATRSELAGRPVSIRTTMGQWDLACNVIHFLDLASYVAGDTDFSIDASQLDKKLLPSKRKGFVELRGTLRADFKNGSRCEFTSYVSGNAPFVLEIFNEEQRYIIREPDGKAWVSNSKSSWQWEEVSFKIPLVSETTTAVVENILANGSCLLTPYKESAKIHMSLLEPLKHFLNKNSEKKYEYYPFT